MTEIANKKDFVEHRLFTPCYKAVDGIPCSATQTELYLPAISRREFSTVMNSTSFGPVCFFISSLIPQQQATGKALTVSVQMVPPCLGLRKKSINKPSARLRLPVRRRQERYAQTGG